MCVGLLYLATSEWGIKGLFKHDNETSELGWLDERLLNYRRFS